MIKINLLPEEYSKRTINFSEILKNYKSLAIPIIGGVIGLIVVFSLVMIIYPKWQDRTLRRIDARWSKIENDYEKVLALEKEEKDLKDKLDMIENISSNRLIWAAKLNQISDALPSEIQLTEMAVEGEKDKENISKDVLIITGIVPAYPGDRAIEEFIRNLGGNTQFVKDFPKIELPITETTGYGFKKFILKCYMADKYVQKTISSQKPEPRKKKPKIEE